MLIIWPMFIRQNLNVQHYLFDRIGLWFNRTLVLLCVLIISIIVFDQRIKSTELPVTLNLFIPVLAEEPVSCSCLFRLALPLADGD